MAFVPAGESAMRKKVLLENQQLEAGAQNILGGLKAYAAASDAELRRKALLDKENQNRIDKENAAEARANAEFNRNERALEAQRFKEKQFGVEQEERGKDRKLKEQGLKLEAERNRILGQKTQASLNKPNASQIRREDTLRERAVTGFDLADPEKVIPTAEDAESVKKISIASDSINQGVPALAAKLRSLKGLGRLNPATKEEIQTMLAPLVTEGKEVDRLGALTGPDLGLELKQLGDPLAFINIVTQDPEKAARAIEKFGQNAREKVRINAEKRGYRQVTQVQTTSPQDELTEYEMLLRKAGRR